MCGIAGFIDPEQRLADPAGALSSMSSILRNRGPDGEGSEFQEALGVGLAHTRLAIFDTSDSGAQPMASASGRFTIVYNGAIYNHPELREELRQRGHDFTGSSDTEVMLAAFEEWGIAESLPRFNGMFAFAVLDRQAMEVLIARDRIGQKPIFVASLNGAAAFASDLNALQVLPEPFATACREINPVALQWYLANGAVPWPLSIHKHIEKLAPGGIVRINLHTAALTRTSWWTPKLESRSSCEMNTEGLLQRLDSAVECRLRSDRDLGVFLSGGIDSRLIAALAARHDPSIKAYTLRLPGPFNESSQAAFMAKKIGIKHTSIDASEADILDTAVNLQKVCDEPFADSSLMATTILSRRVREEIVVALGGDGGDELFGGYRRHAAAFRGHGASASIAAALGWMPRALSGRIPIGRLSLAEGLHRTSLLKKEAVDYLGLRRTQGDADWLLRPPSGMQEATAWLRTLQHSDPPWDGMPLENLGTRDTMRADLRTYLPDDPLVKLDRASMSVALEVRSPMLDKNVVDYALNMPTETLFDQHGGRAPIRAMLRGMGLSDFSAKKGFAVPLFQWLRGPLRDWASALIAQDDGLLEQSIVGTTWNQLQRGRRDHATTIWTVLCWRSWVKNRSE